MTNAPGTFQLYTLLGQVQFITEPSDVKVEIGDAAFFPCLSTSLYQPNWMINEQSYSPSDIERLEEHVYNGTGLEVSNVDASMHMWTYTCFFTYITESRQIDRVWSTTGVLRVCPTFIHEGEHMIKRGKASTFIPKFALHA